MFRLPRKLKNKLRNIKTDLTIEKFYSFERSIVLIKVNKHNIYIDNGELYNIINCNIIEFGVERDNLTMAIIDELIDIFICKTLRRTYD